KASSIAVRKQCSLLEEKIVAHRREHPDHGVRRIRDDLRRHEGIDVSARTAAWNYADPERPAPSEAARLVRLADATVIMQQMVQSPG
ncbi:MAG TPA: hypothetical protein VIV14_09665, partial [Gammaproteobacteria bacterium]